MRQLIALVTVCFVMLNIAWGQAQNAAGGQGGAPAWASPVTQSLRRLGPSPDTPEQPNFQSNLDCTELTYHPTNSSTMQAGCFMPTAYGLVDPDSDLAIFNGTDEGLPLRAYSPQQVLTPWPNTVDTLALSAISTGGSLIGLYKDIVADLQDIRGLTGQLTAKQVNAPPDMTLTDPSGQPLVVNAQTMAFSDSGSWLVAETLGGAFVRVNLATLQLLAFAPSFGTQGSPALLKSQVALSDDGRFVAIENAAAASFKVYDLATCTGSSGGLHPLNCAAYDYWPFINSQIPGIGTISHVRFMNEGLLSFVAAGSSNAVSTYELAPTSDISALIDFLALGDSYTSGEGAFDYLAGTDTDENACHLSAHSYPLLITTQLYESGHSVACSGARLQDILPGQPGDYRGQTAGGIPRDARSADSVARVLADFTPGYLAQADFVSYYQPGVITVSVGGDDIGFGDMIQNCVEPHVSLQLSDNVCYDTYEDRVELKNLIDRTVPRWISLFKRLKSKSPDSRLYIIGYPQIAVDNGDCALNVHLSKSELEFSEEVVSYLNGAVQSAAAASGGSYLDISQALAGHRLCETSSYNVAVNGLTAGTDGGPFGLKLFGKESYHPNALGQALIAAAILKQSRNSQTAASATAPDNSSQTLLNAPKSGRPIATRVPDDGLVSQIINRGSNVALHSNGQADGLRPGSVYVVRLDGAGGSPLASLTSDQDSNLDGSVTIPVSVVPGGHTIEVTGQGEAGEPLVITQPVYVKASPDDSDGDGLPDTNDSCPGAANSHVDSDQDGIDDACDNLISLGNEDTSGTGDSHPDPGSPNPNASASPLGSNTTTNPLTDKQIANTPDIDGTNNATSAPSIETRADTGVVLGQMTAQVVTVLENQDATPSDSQRLHGQSDITPAGKTAMLGGLATTSLESSTPHHSPKTHWPRRYGDLGASILPLQSVGWLPWLDLCISLLLLLALLIWLAGRRFAQVK